MATATITSFPAIGTAEITNTGEVVISEIGNSSSSWIQIYNNGSVSNFTISGEIIGAPVIGNNGEIAINTYQNSGTPQVTDVSYIIQNGQITPLPHFDTFGTQIASINNNGQIAGTLTADSSTTVNQSDANLFNASFTWQNNSFSPLLSSVTFGGKNYSLEVLAGNGAGDLTGFAGTMLGTPSYLHAFLLKNGISTDLGRTGAQAVSVSPTAINAQDVIVGGESTAVGAIQSIPFVWRNGIMSALPTISPTDQIAFASGINDLGIIVGTDAASTAGPYTAVIWVNGSLINLNSLLPANSGWVLTSATGINDSNQIVGNGTYNGSAATFELTLPIITVPAAMAVAQFQSGSTITSTAILDSAANVNANIDGLEAIATAGLLGSVSLTDGGTPTLSVSATQLASDAMALKDIAGSYSLTVTGVAAANATSDAAVANVGKIQISDSAINVSANLDSLESLAAVGKIGSIALTDSFIPTLTISAAQLSSDAAALRDISGYYSLAEAAPSTSATISGASSGLGTTVTFSGTASQYTISPSGDHASFTITGNGLTDSVSNVQALRFSDHTLIVAAQPGSNMVTTGNITELYGAVFGRLPDVPGLSYYQQELAANPSLTLTSLAENFLQSPEYMNNSAHNYAQNATGDTQFITDLYSNLLHRAPASGDAAWYETNVVAPIVGSTTPGTAAYTAALLLAHATVVTDFSASAEFLGNVQVTTQHPADASHWLVLI